MPLLVMLFEVQAIEMSDDTGHSHRAVAPSSSEGEVELIVFDKIIAGYISLISISYTRFLQGM